RTVRSAGSGVLSAPATGHSGPMSPVESPVCASLLATARMRVTGAGSTASATAAVTLTAIMLWCGGHNALGDPVRLSNAGAVVSRTVTLNVPVAVLPAASRAVTVTVVVPSGNTLPGAWL